MEILETPVTEVRRGPIVVVDDDPLVLKAIKSDLQGLGPVEGFTSPKLALERISVIKPSVIVSDLKMKEMNGVSFLSECAKNFPLAGRVLLTAFPDLVDLSESINSAKLTRIITKPWEAHSLCESISEVQKISEAMIENEKLRKEALTDSLTGLANKRHFDERLGAEIARAKRYQRPLSLVMCDADDFKKLNDEAGHPEGDLALIKLSRILEIGRRSMDMVARCGGEEFALILPEAGHDQACEIAKRVLGILKKSGPLTMSFGVATFPEDADSAESLYKKSDDALLAAKRGGKARVVSIRSLDH